MLNWRRTISLLALPMLPAMATCGCNSRGAASVDPPALTGSSTGEAGRAVSRSATNAGSRSQPAKPNPSRRLDSSRIVDKTFDDVKFEMQPDEPFRREMIGPAIESLSGRRIRIRGYILPTAQQRGINQFVLVRDNQQCCFGPGAALYDCILVEMQPGRTAEFSIRPVAVEGTFKVEMLPGADDKPLAIYHLDCETVR